MTEAASFFLLRGHSGRQFVAGELIVKDIDTVPSYSAIIILVMAAECLQSKSLDLYHQFYKSPELPKYNADIRSFNRCERHKLQQPCLQTPL